MSEVIELVTFRTKPGVSEADFVAASQVISDWAGRQPGFHYRSLSRDGQGLWRDIVYWSSQADAQRAAEAFMRDNGQSAFMQMVDADSVVMNHSQVQQAVLGGC
ncbi:hypothetical protein [Marinobacterium arenosum]|uniref:hypothetical protein n=1 Tax=Marinobacterium arenosum TaxID=2862496 RepID=UPI001C9610F0|nr:hypothetical protein [Marinobacterium arenosum]MBY4675557.1 hypothetical protein [Marinobacterium arenosum]